MAYAGKDVSKGNTHPLLVGMQTCAATLEISVVVSQETMSMNVGTSCVALVVCGATGTEVISLSVWATGPENQTQILTTG